MLLQKLLSAVSLVSVWLWQSSMGSTEQETTLTSYKQQFWLKHQIKQAAFLSAEVFRERLCAIGGISHQTDTVTSNEAITAAPRNPVDTSMLIGAIHLSQKCPKLRQQVCHKANLLHAYVKNEGALSNHTHLSKDRNKFLFKLLKNIVSDVNFYTSICSHHM